MPDIKTQKLLYHLTSMKHAEDILLEGLKPRSQLSRFEDVADPEIIANRKAYGLDTHVPFHWFAKNPFDGRVQTDHPNGRFMLISVRRVVAQSQNWKVIPRHPLSGSIQVLDYATGLEAIDWPLMNKRDYRDQECKCVCMAECLSPSVVMPNKFFCIYAKNRSDYDELQDVVKIHLLDVDIQLADYMFIR